MKRVAWTALLVLLTLTGLLLLWKFRDVVGLFLVSLAVAAAIRPLIDTLVARKLPLGVAIILSYGACLLVLGGLFYVAGAGLVIDLQKASDRFAVNYELNLQQWPEGTALQRFLAARLPLVEQIYQQLAGSQGLAAAGTLLGITASLAEIVSEIGLALILSLYWSIDRVRFERLWLSVLPAQHRMRARNIWRAVQGGVGAYIRSELVQSLLAGVVLALGFRVMGLQYPTLLAILGAIAWLVPLVGGALAVVPVFFVGLMGGPYLGVGAALYTGLVFVLLEVLVEPRIFHRQRYNSILIIITMIAMADALGVAGLILAPPLAAAIQILFRELAGPPGKSVPSTVAPRIVVLEERLALVRSLIAEMPDGPSPEVESMVERLERLSRDVRAALEADLGQAQVDLSRSRVDGDRDVGIRSDASRLPG